MEENQLKLEKLVEGINGHLTAGWAVANTLLHYFPDKSPEYLTAFWLNIAESVVKDYKDACDRVMDKKED